MSARHSALVSGRSPASGRARLPALPRPTAPTVVAMKILQIVPALHGAKMETRQGTYPIVVWALTEGDDGSRDVIGLAVAGGKALIPPDPGIFERYTQTG
jgi:hypothetical protein